VNKLKQTSRKARCNREACSRMHTVSRYHTQLLL